MGIRQSAVLEALLLHHGRTEGTKIQRKASQGAARKRATDGGGRCQIPDTVACYGYHASVSEHAIFSTGGKRPKAVEHSLVEQQRRAKVRRRSCLEPGFSRRNAGEDVSKVTGRGSAAQIICLGSPHLGFSQPTCICCVWLLYAALAYRTARLARKYLRREARCARAKLMLKPRPACRMVKHMVGVPLSQAATTIHGVCP